MLGYKLKQNTFRTPNVWAINTDGQNTGENSSYKEITWKQKCANKQTQYFKTWN